MSDDLPEIVELRFQNADLRVELAATRAELRSVLDRIAEHKRRSDWITTENEELWALIEDSDE